MWKNIFIESCILSALIFGGIYINANILKKEISIAKDSLQGQPKTPWIHISGNYKGLETHLSGHRSDVSAPAPSISGNPQPPLPVSE